MESLNVVDDAIFKAIEDIVSSPSATADDTSIRIVNLMNVQAQHALWNTRMGNVQPYYGEDRPNREIHLLKLSLADRAR